MLFHVIPAEAGIQSHSERDFSSLQILWTPVFIEETNQKQFFHTFGESGDFPRQGAGFEMKNHEEERGGE